MPRRGNVPKREILPDPMYNSILVTRLVNSIMLDGKKGVAKLFGCKVVGSGTKALDTNKYNVTVVTDRTKAVANDNIFDKNFDTNPSVFYYDAVGKKTDVTHFITDADLVKSEIPKLAGVNK